MEALDLMIETPGDLVCDLQCLQHGSYLEGGPLMRILPLNQHVNKKLDDEDDDDGITVQEHTANLVMPNSDHHDRFFYPHLTTMEDTYMFTYLWSKRKYTSF